MLGMTPEVKNAMIEVGRKYLTEDGPKPPGMCPMCMLFI